MLGVLSQRKSKSPKDWAKQCGDTFVCSHCARRSIGHLDSYMPNNWARRRHTVPNALSYSKGRNGYRWNWLTLVLFTRQLLHASEILCLGCLDRFATVAMIGAQEGACFGSAKKQRDHL